MRSINPRSGKAIRILLALLVSVMLIPFGLVFLWTASRQQQRAIAQEQEAVRAQSEAMTTRAVLAPFTGNMGVDPRTFNAYQGQADAIYAPPSGPMYAPLIAAKSNELAAKLRLMKPDDAGREAAMKEFLDELGKEFDAMHSRQAQEIVQVTQRLESLKSMHEQRAKSKDKIVERRAEQLIGTGDVYRWEAGHPNTAASPYLPPSVSLPPGGNQRFTTQNHFGPHHPHAEMPPGGQSPFHAPFGPPVPGVPYDTSVPVPGPISAPSSAAHGAPFPGIGLEMNNFLPDIRKQSGQVALTQSLLNDAHKFLEKRIEQEPKGVDAASDNVTEAKENVNRLTQLLQLQQAAVEEKRVALEQQIETLRDWLERNPEPTPTGKNGNWRGMQKMVLQQLMETKSQFDNVLETINRTEKESSASIEPEQPKPLTPVQP